MVLYFSSSNEIFRRLFFVLSKFTVLHFIRNFNKINPDSTLFQNFQWKKSTVLLCFKEIHSRTVYKTFQLTNSPVVLYFNIFNEINPQLLFVLDKFTAVPVITSLIKINPQWYFILAFPMKKFHSSSLF